MEDSPTTNKLTTTFLNVHNFPSDEKIEESTSLGEEKEKEKNKFYEKALIIELVSSLRYFFFNLIFLIFFNF
jgi:hypothetical protein